MICEYIWLDGNEFPQIRSKVKIVDEAGKPPIWGFDGSSTMQAEGHFSDCILNPVTTYDSPFEGSDTLVFCEVLNTDMLPHSTNHRKKLVELVTKYRKKEILVGMEQEYTLMRDGVPFAFLDGELKEQGAYYCGNGSKNIYGREIAEAHLLACLASKVCIVGTNAEVMPGQWEYQVGAKNPVTVADDLWVARFILERIAEEYELDISLDPKPKAGDWNGAGCHTNFSTKDTRSTNGLKYITEAIDKLSKKHKEHIEVYGKDNAKRLTGLHETCSINEFRSGVSDRGASVRIPWAVQEAGCGYFEDRRPSANCDPYLVLYKMVETICE